MCFFILDQPKINSHQILCNLLMSSFSFAVVGINISCFHFLSPVNGLLVCFGLIDEFLVPLRYEFQHFWVFFLVLNQHLKSLDRQLQMLENLFRILFHHVFLWEIHTYQIRHDFVILPVDKVQPDIDCIWKVLLPWKLNTHCIQNCQSNIRFHLDNLWNKSQFQKDLISINNFI